MSSLKEEKKKSTERNETIDEAFKELICYKLMNQYNGEDSSHIVLEVSVHLDCECNSVKSHYMLWDVRNAGVFNFPSELQKKLKLEKLNEYTITTPNNALLKDQEDFYGAIIDHLKDSPDGDNFMKIDVRKKTCDH